MNSPAFRLLAVGLPLLRTQHAARVRAGGLARPGVFDSFGAAEAAAAAGAAAAAAGTAAQHAGCAFEPLQHHRQPLQPSQGKCLPYCNVAWKHAFASGAHPLRCMPEATSWPQVVALCCEATTQTQEAACQPHLRRLPRSCCRLGSATSEEASASSTSSSFSPASWGGTVPAANSLQPVGQRQLHQAVVLLPVPLGWQARLRTERGAGGRASLRASCTQAGQRCAVMRPDLRCSELGSPSRRPSRCGWLCSQACRICSAASWMSSARGWVPGPLPIQCHSAGVIQQEHAADASRAWSPIRHQQEARLRGAAGPRK